MKLYDPKTFHYSWVVRFPLLAWDADEGRYVAEHHPFTMPMVEDLPLLESDPAKVRAQAYGRKNAEYLQSMAVPDDVDMSPWTAVFLCEDKKDHTCAWLQ